jgi:hypothetical protein
MVFDTVANVLLQRLSEQFPESNAVITWVSAMQFGTRDDYVRGRGEGSAWIENNMAAMFSTLNEHTKYIVMPILRENHYVLGVADLHDNVGERCDSVGNHSAEEVEFFRDLAFDAVQFRCERDGVDTCAAEMVLSMSFTDHGDGVSQQSISSNDCFVFVYSWARTIMSGQKITKHTVNTMETNSQRFLLMSAIETGLHPGQVGVPKKPAIGDFCVG